MMTPRKAARHFYRSIAQHARLASACRRAGDGEGEREHNHVARSYAAEAAQLGIDPMDARRS